MITMMMKVGELPGDLPPTMHFFTPLSKVLEDPVTAMLLEQWQRQGSDSGNAVTVVKQWQWQSSGSGKAVAVVKQ